MSLRSLDSSHSERCSLTKSLSSLAPGFVFLHLALSYDCLVNVGLFHQTMRSATV